VARSANTPRSHEDDAVFGTYTLTELAAERQAVWDAVTRLHLVPVMPELGGQVPRVARAARRGCGRSAASRSSEGGVGWPAIKTLSTSGLDYRPWRMRTRARQT